MLLNSSTGIDNLTESYINYARQLGALILNLISTKYTREDYCQNS